MTRALVVVDYQNDFVTGTLGFPEAAEIEDVIADKVIAYKIAGDDIYFTKDCHGRNYLSTQEGKNLPIRHCTTKKGRELYGSLNGLSEGCVIIEKSTFGSTELMDLLAAKAYDEIEFCGLLSNICVLANAVLAKTVLPETVIIVDADATRSNDPALNEKALDIMRSLQIRVFNGRR